MPLFRRKPDPVEAAQWDGTEPFPPGVTARQNDDGTTDYPCAGSHMMAMPGDWILTLAGDDGQPLVIPMGDQTFRERYEEM